jgi:hypothetical protein
MQARNFVQQGRDIMASSRSAQALVLSAALAASCSVFMAGHRLLTNDHYPGEQATHTLLDTMVNNNLVQFRASLREHRDVTYLLERMH